MSGKISSGTIKLIQQTNENDITCQNGIFSDPALIKLIQNGSNIPIVKCFAIVVDIMSPRKLPLNECLQ